MTQGGEPVEESSSADTRDDPSYRNDYWIFVPRDDAKTVAVPWLIKDYGDRGAFGPNDIAELSEKHRLPRKALELLSVQLGYTLDVDSEVNLVKIWRSTAEKRSKKRVKKAINAAKRGELEDSFKLIADLADSFASEAPSSSALAEAQRLGSGETVDAKAYLAALKRVQAAPNTAFDLSPHDKRKVWDMRRVQLVYECCYVWEECGRKVTTMPVDGAPGGPFIDFIQDIGRRLTKGGWTLSPETVRRDIDRIRKPDPALSMSGEPDIGVN